MIENLETLAIHAAFTRTPEYFTRRVYRYYSEKFHTPLMEVYQLPWAFVLTNYLEHIIETNNTQDDMYDLAVKICYPELAAIEEEAINDRIAELERENIQKGYGVKPKRGNPHKEAPKPVEENPPSEPEIKLDESTFAHLDEEMEEDDE